jgi:hypothetical protein
MQRGRTFLLAPSPPLPRKRGRVQTEFAACADPTSPELTLGCSSASVLRMIDLDNNLFDRSAGNARR